MLRAVAMNVGMMVTYDEGKERLSKYLGPQNPKFVEILASVIAALVIGVGSLPLDNVKTKLQKQVQNNNNSRDYRGIADCFAKTIKNEGFRALWVGLPTYYLRVGPHALITLQAAEMLRRHLDA
jgi:solute carrier family 25 (mitochondrial oxoglutarate transporter), member 11